ncbi:MAG: two-component regulator propeller domain-containing protein, partial [Chitinophagaceae bacterium]
MKSDSVIRYNQQTKQTAAIQTGNISGIVPLNHDELFFSTNRFKTFYANLARNEIKLLGSDAQSKDSSGNNLILYSGLKLKEQQHLVCSNKGLFLYNTRTHSITQPVFYYSGRPLENQGSTKSLYKDDDGNIYLNHADGIFFLSPTADFIQYFRNYSFRGEQLPDNDVRNFAEDQSGNIWMATTYGIARLNMQTGELKSFDPLNNKGIIDFPSYRQLLNDGAYLWIGTAGNGVWIYDKQSGLCKRPVFPATEKGQKTAAAFNGSYIWKILKLNNGKLLIVGGSLLFIVDPATLIAEQFPVDMASSISRSAIQDSSGRIWHGTTAGLNCFDAGFNLLLRVKDSFPDKRVASFCEWKKNKMLVGSKGLFEIELRDNKTFSFKRMNAISADRLVYCMKQDERGFVWLGTDDGIFRYDPEKDESILFDRSDHVQSQAFNSDAAFISSSGLMFLGGRNGVNYFDPGAFSPAVEKLHPVVLSFAVNVDDSSYASSNYKIAYSSRNIDFIISAPEFKKPFRVQYRYRLQNGNEKWTYTGFNNHVRISKLQPEDYSLQVSASYDGNTWFNSAESISFTVLSPWWQTWWFRSLCLGALISMIWG